jgi:hypothetical protein
MATTSKAPNSEKEEVSAQSSLTRLVEASLKIAIPDPDEIRFRSSLLNCAVAKISELKPAFITRLYEAACDVKFPSDEVTSFRKELQKVIGTNLNLKKFRNP